jgi:hypothetical protein
MMKMIVLKVMRLGVRRTQRAAPHDWLFVMSLTANAHCMDIDKCPRGAEDLAEHGPHISLAFRHIGTFFAPSSAAGSGCSSSMGLKQ